MSEIERLFITRNARRHRWQSRTSGRNAADRERTLYRKIKEFGLLKTTITVAFSKTLDPLGSVSRWILRPSFRCLSALLTKPDFVDKFGFDFEHPVGSGPRRGPGAAWIGGSTLIFGAGVAGFTAVPFAAVELFCNGIGLIGSPNS